MNKAIFLDRDGTINVDYGYVYELDKLKFIDGVPESLKKLQDAGYLLIIITNQSGVGRGYYTIKDVFMFNNHLIYCLSGYGVIIKDVYTCFHSPDDNCDCRKPSPKFILDAISHYDIDPDQSYMLGDKNSDIEMGNNANVKSFLVTKENDLNYWTNIILNK